MSTEPTESGEKQDERDKAKPERKLTITVVVNGVPADIEQNTRSPLSAVVARALEVTNNVGQSAENWELRTDAGVLLDVSEKIETFNFPVGVTLFLSLRAGVGGEGAHLCGAPRRCDDRTLISRTDRAIQ